MQCNGFAAVQQHDESCRRARFRRIRNIGPTWLESWAIDESRIPREPSWPYHRIMEGVLAGKIRGLWIVGTNPAHSWINQAQARDIFSRLDFWSCRICMPTPKQPGSPISFCPRPAGARKKEHSSIRSGASERSKKSRCRRAHALADFQIVRLVAEYWGCGGMFRTWQTPARVFQILKRLSAGQPCDFSAIDDYEMLDARGGIQWPFADRDEERTERRLFEDGVFFHPDGRARFVFEPPHKMPEQPSRRFPFLLLTGRGSAAQWHTQTRTSNSAVLRKLYPAKVYVEMNPLDARRLGIAAGQSVIVASQRAVNWLARSLSLRPCKRANSSFRCTTTLPIF